MLADVAENRGFDLAAAANAATRSGAWVELPATDDSAGAHRVLVVRRGDVVIGSSWRNPSP